MLTPRRRHRLAVSRAILAVVFIVGVVSRRDRRSLLKKLLTLVAAVFGLQSSKTVTCLTQLGVEIVELVALRLDNVFPVDNMCETGTAPT